ncbi:MAG: [FeFe] hydrogenase H-cluster radical SAM maturase HydG [Desulfovibrionaceae bacterium]|nr:[FeFe] hydrogenase H-cluster radical SAM maturase HydG [Desulfovibrionaceae bacterium]
MAHKEIPAWLDTAAIAAALEQAKAPGKEELQEIFAKSLNLQNLTIEEAASLMAVEDPADRRAIQVTANMVKEKVYGDRVVLTAPLHVSNYCDSECTYCANKHSNMLVERKRMTRDEIVEATRKLIRQGHKRVLLVAGAHRADGGIEYVLEAARTIYSVREHSGEIRRVNINLTPLHKDEYEAFRNADIGSCLLYQDTYFEKSYRSHHLRGPKSNFEQRLRSLDVAIEAGLSGVGMGLMLGLGPWKFDLLALMLHVAHLERAYDVGATTISLHRMRPVPCSVQVPVPYPVSDADYLHAVAIMRLAVPYAGIILTTKEPASLWRQGCGCGCSQLLTGSVANPYEHFNTNPQEGEVKFPIGEDCHVDEVVRFLLEEAEHMPSFCTACPRLGRSGQNFLDMMHEYGTMASQCGPNAVSSFSEYLYHYASPITRDEGEAMLRKKLAKMPENYRGAAERLLKKISVGRVDEFI